MKGELENGQGGAVKSVDESEDEGESEEQGEGEVGRVEGTLLACHIPAHQVQRGGCRSELTKVLFTHSQSASTNPGVYVCV